MPKGYSPAVFISSTCYDLSQIRIDLKIFLESIGLDPVLSTQNSFPVNPNYDAVSNCLETVKNRADILILIVGGRYGHQPDSGKSVTNLEYIEAKSKGIPVYVFVSKSILNVLPIWKKNKEADYSSAVDTPKLFEFVEFLRDESDNWVFPFENAQDLISILRSQLAYLFMDALEYRSHMHGKRLEREYLELSPQSLELLFTQPRGWEHTLFAQVLKDKIDSYRKERFDLQYGVTYGRAINLNLLEELIPWMSGYISEIGNTISSIETLINKGLAVAFGETGVDGDERHIVYVATRIAEGYKKLLDWTLEIRNVTTEVEYEKLGELCSHMTDNVIPEIEEFSKKIHTEIAKAVSEIENTDHQTLELALTLTAPDLNELNEELARLSIL